MMANTLEHAQDYFQHLVNWLMLLLLLYKVTFGQRLWRSWMC